MADSRHGPRNRRASEHGRSTRPLLSHFSRPNLRCACCWKCPSPILTPSQRRRLENSCLFPPVSRTVKASSVDICPSMSSRPLLGVRPSIVVEVFLEHVIKSLNLKNRQGPSKKKGCNGVTPFATVFLLDLQATNDLRSWLILKVNSIYPAKDSSPRKVDRQVGPCLRYISGASLGLREYLTPWNSKSTIFWSVFSNKPMVLSKGLQSTIPG